MDGLNAELDALPMRNWTRQKCGIGRYPNADMGGFRSLIEIDKATAVML